MDKHSEIPYRWKNRAPSPVSFGDRAATSMGSTNPMRVTSRSSSTPVSVSIERSNTRNKAIEEHPAPLSLPGQVLNLILIVLADYLIVKDGKRPPNVSHVLWLQARFGSVLCYCHLIWLVLSAIEIIESNESVVIIIMALLLCTVLTSSIVFTTLLYRVKGITPDTVVTVSYCVLGHNLVGILYYIILQKVPGALVRSMIVPIIAHLTSNRRVATNSTIVHFCLFTLLMIVDFLAGNKPITYATDLNNSSLAAWLLYMLIQSASIVEIFSYAMDCDRLQVVASQEERVQHEEAHIQLFTHAAESVNHIVSDTLLLRERVMQNLMTAEKSHDGFNTTLNVSQSIQYLRDFAKQTMIRNSVDYSTLLETNVTFRPKDVSANKMIMRILRRLQQTCLRSRKSNIKFHIKIADSLKHYNVSIDDYFLAKVLNNVVQNAVDATPSVTSNNEPGEVCVKVQAQRVDDHVHFSIVVNDNGVGISPRVMDMVFDPFFSDQSRHALAVEPCLTDHYRVGLGLTISRLIMARFVRGGIKLSSNGTNQGTSCEITLDVPVTDADAFMRTTSGSKRKTIVLCGKCDGAYNIMPMVMKLPCSINIVTKVADVTSIITENFMSGTPFVVVLDSMVDGTPGLTLYKRLQSLRMSEHASHAAVKFILISSDEETKGMKESEDLMVLNLDEFKNEEDCQDRLFEMLNSSLPAETPLLRASEVVDTNQSAFPQVDLSGIVAPVLGPIHEFLDQSGQAKEWPILPVSVDLPHLLVALFTCSLCDHVLTVPTYVKGSLGHTICMKCMAADTQNSIDCCIVPGCTGTARLTTDLTLMTVMSLHVLACPSCDLYFKASELAVHETTCSKMLAETNRNGKLGFLSVSLEKDDHKKAKSGLQDNISVKIHPSQ